MLSVTCIRAVVVTILVYIPGHAVGRMYKGCSCNYFSLHSQDMLSVACIRVVVVYKLGRWSATEPVMLVSILIFLVD